MPISLKTRPKTDAIIVHCSATPPSMDVGVDEIARWHRRRGFLAIGYHRVIRRDGVVEPGRPVDAIGAHARGWNRRSIGICLVGGVAEKTGAPSMNFTDAQLAALEREIAALVAEHPRAALLGHRDLPGVAKDCPSFDVRAWWRERRGGADAADQPPIGDPT